MWTPNVAFEETVRRVRAHARKNAHYREALAAFQALVRACRPAWADAAIVATEVRIVAETEHRDGDPREGPGYIADTLRTVLLGWSRTASVSFGELRSAAGGFAPTRHLAEAGPETERGDYLGAGRCCGDGWSVTTVRELPFFTDLSRLVAS